tara:strand:- start:76 stop:555 length:480 start_codon:yes stop_codon:yes gene_type:complete
MTFPSKHGAADALHRLHKLESEYLIDLDDAVIVTRREDGKIRLKQSVNLVSSGAWSGAFWGGLIGMMFTGPLGFLVVGGIGAGFGALGGSISDYGVDDDFVKLLSENMKPCCSGLFILIRSMTEDKVLEQLHGLGGEIVTTSLSHDAEDRLREAIRNVP